jgi:hypothetical protein
MHERMDAQARIHMLLQVVQQFTLELSLLQYTQPSISTYNTEHGFDLSCRAHSQEVAPITWAHGDSQIPEQNPS